MTDYEKYLQLHHDHEIKQIVNASVSSDLPFQALPISLAELSKQNQQLFELIMTQDNIWTERVKWTKALDKVQRLVAENTHNLSTTASQCVKEGFPVTFTNHPRPGFTKKSYRFYDLFKLIEISAKVLLINEEAHIESHRIYRCRKCKQTKTIHADRKRNFHIDEPRKCNVTRGCAGTMANMAHDDVIDDIDRFIMMQKIEVQVADSRKLDESLIVQLEEELVNSCRVGDQVTILGIIEDSSTDDTIVLEHAMRAVNLRVTTNMETFDKNNIWEVHCEVYDDWNLEMIRTKENENLIRDEMVDAVYPKLHGLAIVKLALLCVLCSGGGEEINDGADQEPKMREIIHLLMIGPPGCGKSHILKAVKKLSLNAVEALGFCEWNYLVA